LIDTPEQALNVFDLEKAARQTLPPAHYGYLATGVDDNRNLQANRDGFRHFYLRPRRLVDVSHVDMSVELFGTSWNSPIVISPCGSQKAFHPEGELAVARGARKRRHLQILSTVSSTGVEDVIEARGEPVWYQLYPTDTWPIAQGLLRRAEAAGCPVVVLTVDLQPGGKREMMERYARQDNRDCSECHTGTFPLSLRQKPMFQGLDVSGVREFLPTNLTWDFMRRIKDTVSMKLVVKGIMTREDAEQCVVSGADGIIVSNHGGRAEDGVRSTIRTLPEVIHGARGRVPVLVDGGFRRGHDILKAMALGATAICIGRPYLWGLGAFGQPGVERVLDLLRMELELAMQQTGVQSLRGISPTFVGAA
jgi:isopentenyl diphosphate isomerase/L-lactate dehydrogenase-like FMN-dependent dehydrogenase